MRVTILILFQVANDQSSKVKTFPSCGNWNFTWLCKPRIWNYRRWNMYEVIMKSEIISGQKWDLAADVSSAWLGPSLSQLNVSLQETVCKCDISDVLSLAMMSWWKFLKDPNFVKILIWPGENWASALLMVDALSEEFWKLYSSIREIC